MRNMPILNILYLAIYVVAIVDLSACQAQSQAEQATTETYYSNGKQSYDGIGKYYMGREISQVMGHQGAAWLERSEREEEEKVSLVIENVAKDITKEAIVADIGAGTGYYAFKIAELVPMGKVLAVDIQPEMLEKIEEKIEKNGIGNVETILGEEKDPKLPEGEVDFVMFVDVYHELSYPREMMENIVKALKPGGQLLLLEYRKEDPSVPIKLLHKMTEAQAIKEMEAVGFTFVENRDMLPWQHYLLFKK